jgi:hypothetical protein
MKNIINLFIVKFRLAFIAILLYAMACAPFNTLAQQAPTAAPEDAQVEAAFTQQQKLVAVNGQANDLLGCAVAIDGNTAVIGAHKDRSASGVKPGTAYVFVRSGNLWIQQQELNAGENGDRFGYAVAISGDTIVIGAPNDDISNRSNQGSAYVFVRSAGVWLLQQKLTADKGKADEDFGCSVAIKGDTIAAGALYTDVGANESQGAVYLFTRAGEVWTQQQKLTASDGAANNIFGSRLALSSDTLVVGAVYAVVGANQDQGATYVFTRSGTSWSQSQKLTASDGEAGDQFGYSFSINGDTLVVSARFDKLSNPPRVGSAYVFKRAGGNWSQQQKLTGEAGGGTEGFGISVSVSGNRIAIGAFSFDVGAHSSQGVVFIFTQANGVWTQSQKMTSDDGATDDAFGFAVALSANTLVVGAVYKLIANKADQGTAYIFSDPSVDISPKIQSIQVIGKKLIVNGANFESPTEIYIAGQKQKKTFNDEASPATTVVANKAGKLIAPGQTVMIQVRNSDSGMTSSEFMFTRPLE